MNKELGKFSNDLFDNIKHYDENQNEYWSARELMPILEYNKWQSFYKIIVKAMTSCRLAYDDVSNHFTQVSKMVDIGSKTKREIEDYNLSRYACYLIAQNGDSKKRMIAVAQTYFAIQTRKQEILEKDYNELTEDDKRIINRSGIKDLDIKKEK